MLTQPQKPKLCMNKLKLETRQFANIKHFQMVPTTEKKKKSPKANQNYKALSSQRFSSV